MIEERRVRAEVTEQGRVLGRSAAQLTRFWVEQGFEP